MYQISHSYPLIPELTILSDSSEFRTAALLCDLLLLNVTKVSKKTGTLHWVLAPAFSNGWSISKTAQVACGIFVWGREDLARYRLSNFYFKSGK